MKLDTLMRIAKMQEKTMNRENYSTTISTFKKQWRDLSLQSWKEEQQVREMRKWEKDQGSLHI